MTPEEQINQFLNGDRFAVVGASSNRAKYGNKVLRCYQQNDLDVVPINPKAEEIETLKAYGSLKSVPGSVHAVSIITPPPVTEQIVEEADALGIKHLWMQPGAESAGAIERAEKYGMNVIHSGPCILVVLGYRE